MGKAKLPITATRLPPELRAELESLATETGYSVSELIKYAVQFTIDRSGFSDLPYKAK
ncbi:hypothetical protein [Scytonema sp. UIC 10036]|uniref:hypothetical protein n=1 Tax=Scytonema sp. UIC 10036 TaxID=2304196 RepID=UPI00140F61DD|nr:hypothetical protein [Scytonema sp. UIC 10036]